MISIIIPAYNLGKYISGSLDSIRQQSFTDYEVIVVNDGSKDNTLDVLNEYKGQHPEFPLIIIDKQNGGVTAARRDGFMASKGEWISFMDGDDLLPTDSLQILHDEIRPEIKAVCGSFEKFTDGASDYKYFAIKIKEGTYPCRDVVQFIMKSKFYAGPWGKLYHRSLIREKMFNLSREITNKEDVIFNLRVFSQSNGQIAMTYKPVYRYRVGRTDSALYSMYVAKNLDLAYEIRVYHLMMDAVRNMDGFMTEHRDCLSVRNYILLWAWRSQFRNATKEQYTELKKMYNEMHLSDICTEGIKKYIKFILIRLSLAKYQPR